jgi:replicative superfamily II helicase
MVDFGKLKKQRNQGELIDPIEIFMRLPHGSHINDLWNSQAEALKDWFKQRTNRDIIVKLNTGGGKTLVGLLIAQSILNETKAPVLYLCPNNQLVDQTIQKAEEYGFHPVRFTSGVDLDEEFLNGSRVMVGTYSALFNGLSRFGIMGGKRDIVQLGGLILDDAHTAFAEIRDAFTVSIKTSKSPELYQELTSLFRGDFGALGRQGTFDDIVQQKEQSVLEVPYWSWLIKHKEIRQTISKIAQDEYKFEWPLIRDYFHLCHALISSDDFAITPLYPIIDIFPSFSECKRRIYMSATVADDSSIVRTFDVSAESVSKPIAPTSLAGVGEKMILIPGLMLIPSKDINDLITTLIERISKKSGVVVITPSSKSAELWKSVGTVAQGEDVAVCVQSLLSGKNYGPFIFPHRYDGIDLPDNSCRLLILSGLPRGSNTYDLFRAIAFEGSSAINTTIAQRVEQGMGRGTRGAGDYCVVLLSSKHLVSWISRAANLKLLTPITRTQLHIGAEVSHQISSYKEFEETALKCLNRNKDWTEYHAESIADAAESVPVDLLNLTSSEIERKFFKLALNGYYEKAITVIEKYIKDNPALDSKMQSWLLQAAARSAYLTKDLEKSNQLQQRAFSLNRALLRPQVASSYVSQTQLTKQSANIIKILKDFEQKRGLVSHFETIADWLTPSATSNQFEEAMKSLGDVIGYYTERPDHEYQKGPDILWLMDNKTALVIEAKSRKKADNPLTKDEHGQLLEAYQWFKKQYPEYKGYKASIHPNAYTTESVTPDESFALTTKSIAFLTTQVRQLITELCSSTESEDELMKKCDQLLQDLNLTPDLIIQYLRPFKQKESKSS